MSSLEERSPKRQRLSYASPPDSATETKSFVQPPHTPPPSVNMSPSWPAQQLPGLGYHQPANFPTPQSISGMHSHGMARGASSDSGGIESEQQTPAQESEHAPPPNDDEGDAEMTGTAEQEGNAEADQSMPVGEDVDAENRRSDHERQDAQDDVPPPPPPVKLYKLSTEPIPRSRPHASDDMITMYNLTRIQSSVSRYDVLTGEKINKLRKSYAGKLKDLGLEGRNKADKGDGTLLHLINEERDIVYPDGRTEWEHSISDVVLGEYDMDSFYGLLDKALEMRPGSLPTDDHNAWKNLLGLDDPGTAAKVASTTAAAASPVQPVGRPALPVKGAPFAAQPVARPERAGKKRRYDESSYEGYDDDGVDSGGESITGRRGSTSKRLKRKGSVVR